MQRVSRKMLNELQEVVNSTFGPNAYTIYALGERDATRKAYIKDRVTPAPRDKGNWNNDCVWHEFKSNTDAYFWMLDTMIEYDERHKGNDL